MTGTVLWEPPADVRGPPASGTTCAGCDAARRRRFAGYAELWDWSVTDLPTSGSRSGTTSRSSATPADRGAGDAAHAGGAVVPRRDAQLRRARAAHARLARRRAARPRVLAESGADRRSPPRSCAIRSQVRAGLRGPGSPGGPGRRVRPEHPRDVRPRCSPPRASARSSRRARPEFGTRSVIDRWRQIEPNVLLAVDGYRYGDKPIDRRAEVAAIARGAPAIEHVVPIGYPDRRTATGTSSAATSRWSSTRCRSTTRSTCSTPPARPACPSRSCTGTAASCSSTSRCSRCTTTSAPATASSGSPRRAG